MEQEWYIDEELIYEELIYEDCDDKYGISRNNDDCEKNYLIDYNDGIIVVI